MNDTPLRAAFSGQLVPQDPEDDLDYVPNTAREHRVRLAMNNAYAFGGNNATATIASPLRDSASDNSRSSCGISP